MPHQCQFWVSALYFQYRGSWEDEVFSKFKSTKQTKLRQECIFYDITNNDTVI